MRWEPIETAPRDGRQVDVWSDWRRIPNARWMTPVCHVEEYKVWCRKNTNRMGGMGPLKWCMWKSRCSRVIGCLSRVRQRSSGDGKDREGNSLQVLRRL